jgi:hypothetical protein
VRWERQCGSRASAQSFQQCSHAAWPHPGFKINAKQGSKQMEQVSPLSHRDAGKVRFWRTVERNRAISDSVRWAKADTTFEILRV